MFRKLDLLSTSQRTDRAVQSTSSLSCEPFFALSISTSFRAFSDLMLSARTAIALGIVRREELPVEQANLFSEKTRKKMSKRIPRARESSVSRTMRMVRRWASAHKGSMLYVLKRFAWRLDAFQLVLVLSSHILQTATSWRDARYQ